MFASERDAELRRRADDLRQQAQNGSQNPALTVEAFALVTESVRRTNSKVFYDVQLDGGFAMVEGQIAEMQTGEGKTLTTSLPGFAMSLTGRGVHVATTNSYLAQRDCEELRPALELLGTTVGVLPAEHDPRAAEHAYRCDVTFGTGYDFGFDFLRDQIAQRQQPKLELGVAHLLRLAGRSMKGPQLLQRPHAFAIVDEADSVLIDEATMPLILSVPIADDCAVGILNLAKSTAASLNLKTDFELDEAERRIDFTDIGWLKLHEPLNKANVAGLSRPWNGYVQQALRARLFLKCDIDYVIIDGQVQIVDQHTGRIHPERSWQDGLHQAVEVKEGVEVSPAKASEGRVSRQRYFQFYDRLCGMTGTATGNEAEFSNFYGLNVKAIPTHRPCRRKRLATRCFVDNKSRDRTIVNDVRKRQRAGQPVLLGTLTIQHSKQLSQQLDASGISHSLLNGVQDETEATIISKAGTASAVTIATNMAGRGTDIKPDHAAIDAGGLHVIAAGHNVSPRVDRQLVGRAARQGQPGSVQFFVSASDELFVLGKSSLPIDIQRSCSAGGESQRNFERLISGLQQRLERDNFQKRQQMVQGDEWLDSVLATLGNPEVMCDAK